MTSSKNSRSELAIEGSNTGIWDFHLKSNTLFVNDHWAKLIGYKRLELDPIDYDTWVELTHPEDISKAEKQLEKCFNDENQDYDLEIRMKHKQGHWVWLRTKGRVVEWDENGKAVRICGAHTDINYQKENEIALKRAVSERDLLLKEVHHRVKNNLQLLLSLTRLKSKNGIIQTSQIENSINSIAQAYETVYKSDQLDEIYLGDHVERILEEHLRDLKVDYQLNSVELKIDIDKLIALGLIISELINNSLKHSNLGYESLLITVFLEKKNKSVSVSYSDNGKGYEKDATELNDKKENFGLMIIKSLVDQLNGSLKISNSNGAKVLIELPETTK